MRKVSGIIPYLPTPVDAEGRILAEPLHALSARLAGCGVSGICVMGSVGEFPYLTEAQKLELAREAVSAGSAAGLDVVAGVSGFSARQMIEQATAFAGLGVDAIVLMVEQYFPLSAEMLASVIRSVSRAVPDTEVILYSNPKYMHYSYPLQLFDLIADCPNVDGYKDASGNTGFLLSISGRYGSRYRIFSASAHIPLFVFELGGVGWMAGPACIIPRSAVRLFSLAGEGRIDEAMALQRKMWGINAAFARYDLASCIKGVLRVQGFDFGDPIPPLMPLARSEAERIAGLAMSLEQGGAS